MKPFAPLLAGAALALGTVGGAAAADLLQPADSIYSSPLFDFEGFYVGATTGAAVNGALNGTVGVVVGSNFAVSNGLIVGAEFQGDAYYDGGGFTSYDALALGRVGGFVADNTMLYGDLGAGFAAPGTVYALGAGAEMALTGQLSAKVEVQGLGNFGALPSVGKGTVGLLWHLD